jgi:hypothetical protein
MLRAALQLVFLATLELSCGLPSSMERFRSQGSLAARVNQEVAAQAYAFLDKVDYLPLQYKHDGCYARTLFLSMELASQGIPSSAQFIRGHLHPAEGVDWGFHVAPMLKVDGSKQTIIIDPSLFSRPVDLQTWIEKMNPSSDYELIAVPGNFYSPRWPPTSEDEFVISSFDELPAFKLSHVYSACRVLHFNLGYEAEELRVEKRRKLKSRLIDLVSALDRQKKLDWDLHWVSKESLREAVLCH